MCKTCHVAALIAAAVVMATLWIQPGIARDNPPPGGAGASCSIDLPNGLKEPGTKDANGNCCSVFDSKKCQKPDCTIVTNRARQQKAPAGTIAR